MNAMARKPQSKRRGMKLLAALLSTVCAFELLIAFEHIPMQGWRPDALPTFELAAVDMRERLIHLGEQTRARVWPRPVLEATDGDAPLQGVFAGSDAGPGEAVFSGALIRLDDQTWRTEPMRIVAGATSYAEGQSYARRLRAPADAQIELRRIVPNDAADEPEVVASPLCDGRRPGTVALLHRQDQVDVMVFRSGSEPGPDAEATHLCGVWTFVRP